MTEKHYIVTHYADGTPSDKRELSDEEYAELTNGDPIEHSQTDVDEPVVEETPVVDDLVEGEQP
jgi:hypothetical protein